MNWRVSVVIPCWNGRQVLEKNLPAFLKMRGVGEWILVDDASTDESGDWVEKNYPVVVVVKKKMNEGFPVAADLGVKRAKGELVAVINHDLVPRVDTILKAVGHFDDPAVFGVTFRETGEQGWGIARWRRGWMELSAGKGEGVAAAHETFWGSGGETIFRKKMWDELGGYDVIFSPGYWEDLDLGYRARKRGWKLVWEPAAVLGSAERGQSFGRRWDKKALVRVQERNRLLVIWKNIQNRRMLSEHIRAVVGRVVNHPGYLLVVLAAMGRLGTVIARRNVERKEVSLTDEEVFRKFEEA